MGTADEALSSRLMFLSEVVRLMSREKMAGTCHLTDTVFRTTGAAVE